VIVVDTSVVIAFMDRRDQDHEAVSRWLDTNVDELVTTPLAVAEMDHLAARYGGAAGARALRRDLEAGAYGVEWWGGAVEEAVGIAERYASLGLGLTDASLVALAARVGTTRIATLDERHFRSVAPAGGEPAFTLLPADGGQAV
jgi:predicted nucleic acid-binding protein